MDNFDKNFDRMTKAILALWIIGVITGLGTLGFLIWIIIMVMRYFGVL